MAEPDTTIVRIGNDDFERRRVIAQARLRLFGEGPLPRIGRYRIEQRLGAGGMGEVYLAHDEELDRKVAIKRMLAALSSERDQVRLRREARALAKLSHANVVQIYEIGEHEQRTFLVMEYVDGSTLAHWLEQQRPWPEVLARFVAAGRGLAAAHRAGVVHRDFKPENVLLGRDGSVRVADFGLALAGEQASVRGMVGKVHDLRSSMTGSIAGTIRYMALEQLLGEHVDARSDQFSFCVALYEALYRSSPFPLDTLETRLEALERGEVTPPRSSVPRSIWLILRRALARDPGERWPDMDRLLAALEAAPRRRRVLQVLGVALPLLAAGLGVQEWVAAREQATVLAACEASGETIAEAWDATTQATIERAFIAADPELAASAWPRVHERADAFVARWSALRSAACRENELEGTRSSASRHAVDACLDEAREAFVVFAGSLALADASTVRNATMMAHNLPVLDSCTDPAWLAARVRPSPLIEPEVERLRVGVARARALKLAVRFEAGMDEAETALRGAEVLGWAPLVAEARLVRGELRERLGELDGSRDDYHRAFLDATAQGHDFVAMRASIGMASVEVRRGQLALALEWGALALALQGRLGLLGTMHEASARYAIGRAERALGAASEARRTFERVLALDEAAHGPDHPDNAVSLNMIGMQWRLLGNFDAAERSHARALAIQTQVHGPGHPDRLSSLFQLAKVAEARGDDDLALERIGETLALEQLHLGPEHVDVADTLHSQARMLRARARRSDLDAAVRACERALAIAEVTRGPGDPSVAFARVQLGDALLAQGQPEAARRAFERAHEIASAGDDQALLASTLAGLGHAQADLGVPEQAAVLLDDALALGQAARVEEPQLADSRLVYAETLWQLGRREQARDQALLARAACVGPDAGTRRLRARIEAWLREHA